MKYIQLVTLLQLGLLLAISANAQDVTVIRERQDGYLPCPWFQRRQ